MENSDLRVEAPAKEIVIISTHRSGTNFFCECLNAFPEVMGLYEIFNPAGAFGVTRDDQVKVLNEISNLEVKRDQDPALINLFNRRPKRALDLMNRVAVGTGRSILSYKIFQQQLTGDVVKEIIAKENRQIVFLTRGRLDTYISYQKARRAKAWTNKDTSEMKPKMSIRAFLERSAIIDAWHEEVADILDAAGKPYRVFSYGRDVDMPKPELIANLQATLADLGISVTMPEQEPAMRHKRQDTTPDPFEKISNGEAVRRKLQERGLMDFALGEPLGGRDVLRGHVTPAAAS